MRVVHRRAEHEAVGFLRTLDELVYAVVVEDAPAGCLAGAARRAVAHGLDAELPDLVVDAALLQRLADLGQRGEGAAALVRAAVEHEDVHGEGPSSVTVLLDDVRHNWDDIWPIVDHGGACDSGWVTPLGRITLLGRAALPGPLLGLLSGPLLVCRPALLSCT